MSETPVSAFNLNIAGDSHTVSLGLGLRAMKARDAIPFAGKTAVQRLFSGYKVARPFAKFDGERLAFLDKKVRIKFAALTGREFLSTADGDTTFVFSFGLMHRHLSRLFTDDRLVPTGVPVFISAGSYNRVSQAVVRETVLKYNVETLKFFEAAKMLKIPFLVAAPPPMRADDANVSKEFGPEAYARTEMAFRAVMEQELARRNIVFVTEPEESADARGCMKSEFKSGNPRDDHHANAAYGELMLKRIWRAIDERMENV